MGLDELLPHQWKEANFVGVLPMTGVRIIGGFGQYLSETIAGNAAKLGEASGHERHLAVLIDRFDAAPDPSLTQVPEMPPELDCLWVVHRWRTDADQLSAWVARSGDQEWRIHASKP
jgi:hypothetical protein